MSGIFDAFTGGSGNFKDVINQSTMAIPNLFTPTGKVVSTTVGGKPNIRVVESAAVRRQREQREAITDLLLGSSRGLAEQLPGEAFAFEGLPDLPVGDDVRGRIERSTFDRALNLLEPRLERQEEALLQSLADRGQPVGSEGFEFETGERRRAEQQMLENLALSSVAAGDEALSREFGRTITSRQQLAAEQAQVRNTLLAEVMALLTGSPTSAPPGVPAPVAGASALMAPGMMQAQAEQDLLAGLLGLGGTVGGAALLGPAGGLAGGGMATLAAGAGPIGRG